MSPGVAQHSLAEVEEQLLKDEDGASAAEDDEGLPGEEAEHGAGHGRAQEALHDPLGMKQRQRYGGARPCHGPMDPPIWG